MVSNMPIRSGRSVYSWKSDSCTRSSGWDGCVTSRSRMSCGISAPAPHQKLMKGIVSVGAAVRFVAQGLRGVRANVACRDACSPKVSISKLNRLKPLLVSNRSRKLKSGVIVSKCPVGQPRFSGWCDTVQAWHSLCAPVRKSDSTFPIRCKSSLNQFIDLMDDNEKHFIVLRGSLRTSNPAIGPIQDKGG